MPNKSWRHHYIPQFYLKNFTNEDNKFYIYLPEEKRYKDRGRLFAPRQIFYEKNGNTLIFKNKILDFVESEWYNDFDNKIAKVFQKIKLPHYRDRINDSEFCYLELFVAYLYWRNPLNDKPVIQLLKDKGLKAFGLRFKDKYTGEIIQNSDIEREMNKNPTTYKMIKHLLPLFLYQNVLDNKSPLDIIEFDIKNKPSLITDNPIIFRNPKSIDIYKEDFIIPIDSNKILVRGENIKKQYSTKTIFTIDYLLLKQANKYVATTDTKYIPLLEKSQEKSISSLRGQIFKHFFE